MLRWQHSYNPNSFTHHVTYSIDKLTLASGQRLQILEEHPSQSFARAEEDIGHLLLQQLLLLCMLSEAEQQSLSCEC